MPSCLLLVAAHLLVAPPTALEAGQRIERLLDGRQSHVYELHLSAGEYAKVIVEQHGIDLFVAVTGSNGKERFESGAEMGLAGQEEVEIVAASAEVFRLEIKAEYQALPAGRYAIALAERRLASHKEGTLYGALTLTSEAMRLRRAGNGREALGKAQEALEIRERELGPDHPETARALLNLSKISQDLGLYDQAQQQGERALRSREAAVGAVHPDVGAALDNLGNIFRMKEDYPTAINYLLRAREVFEKCLGPGYPTVAVVLINAGVCYRRKGDLAGAEKAYLRAIRIQENALGPMDFNVAVAANNLGLIYDGKAEYPSAREMFRRAIHIIENTRGADHASLRDPLMNLANAYSATGEFTTAEPLYERALRIIESSVGLAHPAAATLMVNWAALLRYQGNSAGAEKMYRQALAIREDAFGPDHPSVARVLDALALLLEARGALVEALAAQQRSVAIAERELEVNLAIGSERERLAYFALLQEQTAQVVSTNLRHGTALPGSPELAAAVLLHRKGRVQEAFGYTLSALRRRAEAGSLPALDELHRVTADIARTVLEGAPVKARAAQQDRLRKLEARRDSLEESLSRQIPGIAHRSNPVPLSAIQAALPPDAALIEFLVFQPPNFNAQVHSARLLPPRYAAMVLRREGAVQWRDLGSAETVDRAISTWRSALAEPKGQDAAALARAMDKLVMQPVRTLAGDASRLLISSDGALNLIPFAALLDENRRYLLERYSIVYLTTGRDLLRNAAPTPSPVASRPLILADPDFGDPAGGAQRTAPMATRSINIAKDRGSVYFAPLPGTAREAKAIAALFPGSLVLTGAGATESALKRAAAPPILHVATHGFFLDGASPQSHLESMNPMVRSGLALSGANVAGPNGEDGILTALEAAGLNLWGTRLVTLSACDTGLGVVQNGEGVYGLRRALLLAGAETLVMSLWPVSDQITRELMGAYYTRLRAGEGKGEALRHAQLALARRSGRAHPFYWASFIQIGEWTPLEGRR